MDLLFPGRWFRRRQDVLTVLLQVILQRERPAVRGAANVTAELQVIVLLVRLYVSPGRVQGSERSGTLGATKRFRVTVLVAGQLDPRFERLRTIRARVSAFLAVRQQMMIVHGRCLESLAAVLASVRSDAGVSPHVQRKAIGNAERLAAYFARVRFFPGVYTFVFNFLVRSRETSTAVLALIRLLILRGFGRVGRCCGLRRRRCR